MTLRLLLIDDNTFWKRKEFWNADNWNDFPTTTLNANEFTDLPECLISIHSILEESSTKICIVTDAHLWFNQSDGSDLLKAVSNHKLFQAGVVYSSAFSVDEILQDAGKVIGLTRGATQELQILEFFRSGRKPLAYEITQKASQFSHAVHSLENLVLPLQLDIETLKDEGLGTTIVEEIFKDYFSKFDPVGYLSEKKEFTNGRLGIEAEVDAILEAIANIDTTRLQNPLRTPETTATTKANQKPIVDQARDALPTHPGRRKWLIATLDGISNEISDLANRIRAISKTIEVADESGREQP